MGTNERRIRIWAALAAVAALIAIEIVLRPNLWCYTNLTLRPNVLPTRLIRSAIKFASGHAAPAVMEDAQGIVHGGRDPAVFVWFRTDDQGLRYILQEFGGPDVTVEVLDMEVFRAVPSGWFRFAGMKHWQEKLGVHIYDPSTIRSARVLVRNSHSFDPSYYLLIDEEQLTVYILAIPHT
jgi:hypothetical protein